MINVSCLLSQTLVLTKVSDEYTMQQDTADKIYTVVFSLKHYINWILNDCIRNTQTSSQDELTMTITTVLILKHSYRVEMLSM